MTSEEVTYSSKPEEGIHVLIRIGDCRPMAFINADGEGAFVNFVPLWQSYLDLAETFDASTFDEIYRSAASPMHFLAINDNIRVNLNIQLLNFIKTPEIHSLLPNRNDYEGTFPFSMDTFNVVKEWADMDFGDFKSIVLEQVTENKVLVSDDIEDLLMPLMEDIPKAEKENKDEPEVPDLDKLKEEYVVKYKPHGMLDAPTGNQFEPLWEIHHKEEPPFFDDETSSTTDRSPVLLTLQQNLSGIQESESDSTTKDSLSHIDESPSTNPISATTVLQDEDSDQLISATEENVVKKRIKDKGLAEVNKYYTDLNLYEHVVSFILVVLTSLNLNKPMLAISLMQGSTINEEWQNRPVSKWDYQLSPLESNLTLTWQATYGVPWFDEFNNFPTDPGTQNSDGFYENIKALMPDSEKTKISQGKTNPMASMTHAFSQYGSKNAKYLDTSPGTRDYQYIDIVNKRQFGKKKVKAANEPGLFSSGFLNHYFGESFKNKKSIEGLFYYWLCYSLKIKEKSRLSLANVESALPEEATVSYQLLPGLMSLNPHDYGLQEFTINSENFVGVSEEITRSSAFIRGGRLLSLIHNRTKNVKTQSRIHFTVQKLREHHHHHHRRIDQNGENPLFI